MYMPLCGLRLHQQNEAAAATFLCSLFLNVVQLGWRDVGFKFLDGMGGGLNISSWLDGWVPQLL